MFRFALVALALALGSSAYAQTNVLPEIGIQNTGSCRNITIRDRSNNSLVPIGCIDTSTHTFSPVGGGAVTNTAVLGALGYTPASKSGDTFSGGVVLPYIAGSGNAVGSGLQNFPTRPNNQIFLSGTGPQISDCNTFENCGVKTLDTQFVQALIRGRSQKDARYDEYTLSLDSYFNTGLAADWAAGTAYATGTQVVSGPNLYVATSSGTSGGSAPSGTGTFNDGGVNWQYQVRPGGGEKVGISSLVQAGPGSGKVWGAAINTVFLPGAKGLNRNGVELDYSNLTKPCAVTAVCYGLWQYGFSSFPITANYTQSTPSTTPAVDVPQLWQASHAYVVGANGSPIVYNAGQYYFLTKEGTSAGSGGPTGTAANTDIADGSAVWHWYDTDGGYYNGSPYMGGAAYYGMLFQNANTIQHTVIYDATKAWYGYQGAPEARHEGAFIRDRSTSKISFDFAGNNSDFTIRDTSVSPTFANVQGSHSFAGFYDATSANAFRTGGSHSNAGFYENSATPVGLALSGAYSTNMIQGNAFAVDPNGQLTAASSTINGAGTYAGRVALNAGAYLASGQTFCVNGTSAGCIYNSGGNVNINAPTSLVVTTTGASLLVQNSVGACAHTAGTSTETVTCTSDQRLKSDIVDAKPALPQLGDLRVREFTVKSNGERRVGTIAQETRETHPEMVHEGQDGMLTVDQPNPWLMTKAIQELKADNDNLRFEMRIAEVAGGFGLLAVALMRRRSAKG